MYNWLIFIEKFSLICNGEKSSITKYKLQLRYDHCTKISIELNLASQNELGANVKQSTSENESPVLQRTERGTMSQRFWSYHKLIWLVTDWHAVEKKIISDTARSVRSHSEKIKTIVTIRVMKIQSIAVEN